MGEKFPGVEIHKFGASLITNGDENINFGLSTEYEAEFIGCINVLSYATFGGGTGICFNYNATFPKIFVILNMDIRGIL